MRMASVRSSAKDPRPEPSTSPICGRSAVCESTNAAADSARLNRSGFMWRSKLGFEVGESSLQLPLHASALTRSNQLLAFSRDTVARRFVIRANRSPSQTAPIAPQTITRNKTMFQALARHAFQIGIRQAISLDRSQIFMRHIAARNAL